MTPKPGSGSESAQHLSPWLGSGLLAIATFKLPSLRFFSGYFLYFLWVSFVPVCLRQ